MLSSGLVSRSSIFPVCPHFKSSTATCGCDHHTGQHRCRTVLSLPKVLLDRAAKEANQRVRNCHQTPFRTRCSICIRFSMGIREKNHPKVVSNHGHIMVKVRERRLFQTIEIFTHLLGDVYTMTLVRTTARVGLAGRYRSLRCGRAEKKRATESHGQEIPRTGQGSGCTYGETCTLVCLCACV